MFENTLISAEQNWFLWAILFTAASFGVWAELKTKWGNKLSAVVIAILFTFVLSNLSIIPTDAPAYDVVWSYLIPLAVPLLLFKADLRRIIKESGPTLLAFTIGGIGTVAGTVIAYNLIPLGDEGWKLAGIFCSTYIGGSMNYVAASQALQLNSSDLLAAGVAADNLMMTIYFLILFSIPSIGFLKKRFKNNIQNEAETASEDDFSEENSNENPSLLDLGKALSIGLIVSAFGFMFQELIGIKGSAILIITFLVVALATIFPDKMKAIKGADQIGTLLMQVFFAAIGASANIIIVLKFGPVLFLFAALILFIHLLFILFFGK